MDGSIVGSRIRQRRKEMGVTQARLARSLGISPSYLNLIEWNKRRIPDDILARAAEALGVRADDLAGAGERRLHDLLVEIAHLPPMRQLDIDAASAGELIGRFPGWANAIAALARSEQEAQTRARTLSDRLSNDPFLSESVHRMLTRIASVRSAADILNDFADIDEDRKARFVRIIHDEARTLSDVGEALAAYLDKAEDSDRVLTPLDEVEALFEARGNRFEEIDKAAEDLVGALADERPVSRRARARTLATERLGLVIDRVIGEEDRIGTAAARSRARRALLDYAVGAILMPSESFAGEAAAHRYDIEALAETFSVEIETLCHRMTALPRGEAVPRFGYFLSNAAGTIVERLGLEGLTLPRYAAACPLWALYRAQQSPETVIRQRTLFPSGARFVFLARARLKGASGFGKPRHYVTDMIAMTEDDARHTVYAPDPSVPVEEVGPSCRLCPRRNCAHRVEDPLAE